MCTHVHYYMFTHAHTLFSKHAVLSSLPLCLPNHKGKRGRRAKSEDEASPDDDEDEPKGRGRKRAKSPSQSGSDDMPQEEDDPDGDDSEVEDLFTPDSPKVHMTM